MIVFQNHLIEQQTILGIVVAEGIRMDAAPPGFEEDLGNLIAERGKPLSEEEEVKRGAVRDMLRNGRFRPTGRSKPASEYLLRSAGEGVDAFPRINAAVDVCNFISLKHLLSVSIWDLDLAGSDVFEFRLGREGEAYVFNAGGQVIELEDLIVGCRLSHGESIPIVTPVKDSLATKTVDATTRVAGAVYAPLGVCPVDRIEAVCREFAGLLEACGEGAHVRSGVVPPGETCRI